MSLVCFFVALITGFLSSSSIYNEREKPNLYEEVLYSDSFPDENVAAMDYSRKRKTRQGSWKMELGKFCIYLPPSKHFKMKIRKCR